jgi:hypothetical protein
MSLIFDRFPSTEAAETFVAEMEILHGLPGKVYATQAESNKDDFFPWRLDPPIALIDRASLETEEDVERAVIAFGGEFAGT